MAVTNIILTFDYELFLGNPSGHLRPSLLEPTENILKLLSQYQVKAVFYIDLVFLIKCREDSTELFQQVSNQVKNIHQQGHEIGLHLHPHWLDSEFKDEQWIFKSFEKFRMHSLSDVELTEIFTASLQVIREITKDEKFQFSSFRAGGWCLQPFSKIKQHFQALDIKIDSSVLRGLSKNQGPHFYDYTSASEKVFWKFSEDPLIEEPNGVFFQVPASTVLVSGVELVINKLLLKLFSKKTNGDGRGIDSSGGRSSIVKRIFSNSLRNFTIENTSQWLLKRMIQRFRAETVVFVAHPKSISLDTLKNLEMILKRYQFFTMREFVRHE